MSMTDASHWPIVIVESPFAGGVWTYPTATQRQTSKIVITSDGEILFKPNMTVEAMTSKDENLHYARLACFDCLDRKEVPYASHLFFPQFLNDDRPPLRTLGITAGYAFWRSASKIVFYVDRGWSNGMEAAQQRAKTEGRIIEYRSLEQKE